MLYVIDTLLSYFSGFGKYNYLLMLVTIPASWATVFDTTTMSYILPSAECDLLLSNLNKGVLNAMVYAGKCTSTRDINVNINWDC